MGYYYKNPGRIEDKTTFINQFKRLVTTYSYTDKSLSLILPQTNYMVYNYNTIKILKKKKKKKIKNKK